MCDYSEAYILVTGDIENRAAANGSIVCFKNCAPFTKCTSHISDELLEFIMPMYNLIEYSDNYEDSTGSLYHFKRDEITSGDDANADIAVNNGVNNSTSFTYKVNLVANNAEGVKLMVPLKYLGNFFRSLEMPLINCKCNLELNWTQNCLLSNVASANAVNKVTFKITDTKLYVPIVTLSAKDTSHLSNLLSEGFKRSIFWNEYKAKGEYYEPAVVRILIDRSIQGVNKLFVLSFTSADRTLQD